MSSPSSAMTMVTAPRAWISRMLLSSLACRVAAFLGEGHHDDDRQAILDERDRPVFEFAGGEAPACI